MSDPAHKRISDAADEEVAAYRGLSSLALAGLAAGLLSPLGLLGMLFWLVPLAAVAASAIALRQIAAQAPNLIGRKAALAGMFLGVVFLVAAPVEDAIFRYLIRREARAFAAAWIDDVRTGQVLKAHNLTIEAKRRAPPDVPLAKTYREGDFYQKQLNVFLDDKTIRTLFALGKNAEYRFYETAKEDSAEGINVVQSTYAVTFTDENEQKKTFFITLNMTRTADRETGRCDWTMGRAEGGVKPAGW